MEKKQVFRSSFRVIGPDACDLLPIPGGQASTAFRWNEAALKIVSDFFEKANRWLRFATDTCPDLGWSDTG